MENNIKIDFEESEVEKVNQILEGKDVEDNGIVEYYCETCGLVVQKNQLMGTGGKLKCPYCEGSIKIEI